MSRLSPDSAIPRYCGDSCSRDSDIRALGPAPPAGVWPLAVGCVPLPAAQPTRGEGAAVPAVRPGARGSPRPVGDPCPDSARAVVRSPANATCSTGRAASGIPLRQIPGAPAPAYPPPKDEGWPCRRGGQGRALSPKVPSGLLPVAYIPEQIPQTPGQCQILRERLGG